VRCHKSDIASLFALLLGVFSNQGVSCIIFIMDIDKPLDDIIKENRIGKRAPKGRGGKAAKRGGRGGKAAVSAPAAALRRNLAKKAATRGKGKTGMSLL
jgi:hypothetical protein